MKKIAIHWILLLVMVVAPASLFGADEKKKEGDVKDLREYLKDTKKIDIEREFDEMMIDSICVNFEDDEFTPLE